MEKITIDFDAEGTPTIHVEGHPGPGCHDLTKALEKALGGVKNDKNTNEYSMPVVRKVMQDAGR